MNSKQVKELNNKWTLKSIKNIILYINSFLSLFSKKKMGPQLQIWQIVSI